MADMLRFTKVKQRLINIEGDYLTIDKNISLLKLAHSSHLTRHISHLTPRTSHLDLSKIIKVNIRDLITRRRGIKQHASGARSSENPGRESGYSHTQLLPRIPNV